MELSYSRTTLSFLSSFLSIPHYYSLQEVNILILNQQK